MYSREKKSSSTHQNTDTGFPNQETLQATRTNAPIVRKLQNKELHKLPKFRKAIPNSNINRMKRQRNTQQVKEQDKCPAN